MVIKWDAKIVNDVENEMIAWTTLEGSGVDHSGTIRFSDEEDGMTRIDIVFRYDPPADMVGVFIAKLFKNDPQRQIEHDLEQFKAIMEIGGAGAELATTDSPAPKRRRKSTTKAAVNGT
jgi:uncharacterized membrane protein